MCSRNVELLIGEWGGALHTHSVAVSRHEPPAARVNIWEEHRGIDPRDEPALSHCIAPVRVSDGAAAAGVMG